MKLNIRNVGAYLFAICLITLGFVRRARLKAHKNAITSIYFHKPSKREFEKTILYLKKHNYKFLSIDELCTILEQNLPYPVGSVILTVDDGWQSNEVNVVGIAEKHKVPVTIFVSTEPVEEGVYWWSYIQEAINQKLTLLPANRLKRFMNENRLKFVSEAKKVISIKREAMTVDQIERIANSAYVTIGGHTHTHPILTNCTSEELYNEITISKDKLESWIGKEVTYFAYPNGDFGEREMQALKDLNYRLAFTSQPKYLEPQCQKDYHSLPRFGYLEGASFAENICRICGVWHPITSKIKSILFNSKQIMTDNTEYRTSVPVS